MNKLKIYKSSAGSGKTFTLVIEFLKLVLEHPEDYKSILAITFTNKAAEEMKTRIVEALVSLSNGDESSIRKILENDLPKINHTKRATIALKNILHDYSSFSIGTIDSFFQRILRALAREINIPTNLEVKVENDDAILDVTDRLLKDVGVDKDLTDWLTQLALQKMDDEQGWNIEKDIEMVARELFKESRHNAKTLSREEIHVHYKKLLAVKHGFEKQLKTDGEKALTTIMNAGLSVTDFAYGSSGVVGYFEKISSQPYPDNYKPKTRALDAANDANKWSTKSNPKKNEVIDLANSTLIDQLQKIISFVDSNYKDYITAIEILKKVYLFGIVNDLQKKFSEYRNENNLILLSDTTRMLSDMIHDTDTPFLYEKTGNRYKHLLIDEFQDTSSLQWRNLLPLIVNALGSGFMTLIVGDAKQSIYRWRGGNTKLLLKGVHDDLKNFKELFQNEFLSVNYRSKQNIVDFNNEFFLQAAAFADEEVMMNDFPMLKLAYDENLKQTTFRTEGTGGYVSINFLENSLDDDGDKISWKENSKVELLKNIRDLQNKNFQLKDICILVRKNSEGNDVATWLFENGIEKIISPDSLLINASPKIDFIINIFVYLSDNTNAIARSEIIYFYRRFIDEKNEEDLHSIFVDHKSVRRKSKQSAKQNTHTLFEGLEDNVMNKILPESFTSKLSQLSKLPVYELSEQVISIFRLNEKPDAYIQQFQDLVLEYTTKSNSSLEGFLYWWETAKAVEDASVKVPENINAIRIMTIHGSKGLQFPIVLMPFVEWNLKPKANETMWLDTATSPFSDLGVVAVSSGSRLKETWFSDQYENEVFETILDNLNMLYVAFTRAEEKLFVVCPADNESELNNISKLIYRTCLKIDPSLTNNFVKGENSSNEIVNKKVSKFISETMQKYPSNKWQEKLTLSSHSPDLLALLEDRKITSINYGILIHSILAAIKNVDEIDKAIDTIVFEGLIGNDERKQLSNEIGEVISVTAIRELFNDEYETKVEQDIILPGGELFRPDRVMIKNKNAIVVDFKTGKKEKKHASQVNQYAELLRKMGYANVKAKLVYISEREVLDVSQ